MVGAWDENRRVSFLGFQEHRHGESTVSGLNLYPYHIAGDTL